MIERSVRIAILVVLGLAIALAMPHVADRYLLWSAQRRFWNEISSLEQPYRDNIDSVTVGMDRATVVKLLGTPAPPEVEESESPEHDAPMKEVYVFTDRIEWGDTFFNVWSTSVSVEYAADNKTVAAVNMDETLSGHADVFEPITVEWMENALRRLPALKRGYQNRSSGESTP